MRNCGIDLGNSDVTAYTIGFKREDGSFQVLATLNNVCDYDTFMNERDFEKLKLCVQGIIAGKTGLPIESLPRQDAPDHINLEE